MLRGINAIKFRRLKYGDAFWRLLSTSLALKITSQPKSHNPEGNKVLPSKPTRENKNTSDCESTQCCSQQELNVCTRVKTQISFTSNISADCLTQISCDENSIHTKASRISSQTSFDDNVTNCKSAGISSQYSHEDNILCERLRSFSIDSSTSSITDNDELPHRKTSAEMKRHLQLDEVQRNVTQKISNVPTFDPGEETNTVVQNMQCHDSETKSSSKKVLHRIFKSFHWKGKNSKKKVPAPESLRSISVPGDVSYQENDSASYSSAQSQRFSFPVMCRSKKMTKSQLSCEIPPKANGDISWNIQN